MSRWDKREGESEREHHSRITNQMMEADVLRRDRISPDDPDFAEKVMARMSGPVDPSIARHHEFEGMPEHIGILLRGERIPESWEEARTREATVGGKPISWLQEPGTVSALHTHNTPSTYAHEFRHMNYPHLNEGAQRIIDTIAAQDDWEVDESVRMFADEFGEKNAAPSESLPNLESKYRYLENWRGPTAKAVAEISGREVKDIGDVIEESAMSRFMDDVREYEDWNEDLPERNRKRLAGKPETIADTIRAVLEKMGL